MFSQPFIFVTLGFPGSGKTYFSEKFSKEIRAFHLNSDEVRSAMFSNPVYTREEHDAVFKVMDYICEELIDKGISVVYDANNNRASKRKFLREISIKHNIKYLLLYFKTPIEIAKARNAEREGRAKVEEEVILRMERLIEEPADDEPHVEIDGTAIWESQFEIVKQRINELIKGI